MHLFPLEHALFDVLLAFLPWYLFWNFLSGQMAQQTIEQALAIY
jgi:hypothetical protein